MGVSTVWFFMIGVWSQRGLPASAVGHLWEGLAREARSQTEIYRASLIASQSKLGRDFKSCLKGRVEQPGRVWRLLQASKCGHTCQEMFLLLPYTFPFSFAVN